MIFKCFYHFLTCEQMCKHAFAGQNTQKCYQDFIWEFGDIYRQSSVKIPPMNNTSSNNTLHIFYLAVLVKHHKCFFPIKRLFVK